MVKLKKIKDIINTSIPYTIPTFQRDFAWEEKNVKLMLDDIMSADEQYILGPIVVSHDNKVIDGQQRLTSLMIILIALGMKDVDFLKFENRKHVEVIFDVLKNKEALNEDYIKHHTCEKIFAIHRFVLDYLEMERINKILFKENLLENVCFIEKILPKDGQKIQHAFEVLNTAGEQLRKEDIAKAKIISYMSRNNMEKESELFNFAWLLCYDIENDLPEELISKRKEIKKASSLADLFETMKGFLHFYGESVTVKLSEVVLKVEGGKIYSRTKSGKIADYATGEYSVCLTPYELLDTVLYNSLEKTITEIVNPEYAFADVSDATEVIKSLLLYRIAFDKYVVKRRKGSRDWLLSSGISGRKRLIMIESMLAVSGVETSKKMVNLVTKEMERALNNNQEFNVDNIIYELEQFAIEKAESIKDYDNGVCTDHFIFYWLDYLLWLNPPEEIKDKADKFIFTYTSSIEHFMPQNPIVEIEHNEGWKEELNRFGNLALISPSTNSRQGNSLPDEKVKKANSKPNIESLKYELMMAIAESSKWTVEQSDKHGDMMKQMIKSYISPIVDL